MHPVPDIKPATKLGPEQLASSSARKAKIRIALEHLPLRGVSRGRDQPGEVLDQANKLQQILEIGGVHAYVSWI